MNINDTKLTLSKGAYLNTRQMEKLRASHKDRGDATKMDTVNVRKNEEIKMKTKVIANIDKLHKSNLSKFVKRDLMEAKDSRKDTKNQKEDKTKLSEEIIKSNKQKILPKASSNKDTNKNTTESNKSQIESKSQKILRINMPNINDKNSKTKKSVKKLSKSDVKGSRNCTLSPILTKKASPSTEVAKWPGNKLAKPYYEAWVNYAGVSKNMAIMEKNTRVQKQYRRYRSPELMHENYADEKFTGRIKVNYK